MGGSSKDKHHVDETLQETLFKNFTIVCRLVVDF